MILRLPTVFLFINFETLTCTFIQCLNCCGVDLFSPNISTSIRNSFRNWFRKFNSILIIFLFTSKFSEQTSRTSDFESFNLFNAASCSLTLTAYIGFIQNNLKQLQIQDLVFKEGLFLVYTL